MHIKGLLTKNPKLLLFQSSHTANIISTSERVGYSLGKYIKL